MFLEHSEETLDVSSKVTLLRRLQRDSNVPPTAEEGKYSYTPLSGKSSITVGAVENTRLASPAPWAATMTSADAKSFTWSSNSKLLRTTVWKPQPSSARAISS